MLPRPPAPPPTPSWPPPMSPPDGPATDLSLAPPAAQEESNDLFRSLVPKLSHFRRSGGRDHVFVWGGGFAVDGPFRDWRAFIPDSIFLMTETEFWNPYKWQVKPNFMYAKEPGTDGGSPGGP